MVSIRQDSNKSTSCLKSPLMAVILTGATGFIGNHLLEALASTGEEVRCLVRRPGPVNSPAGSRFHMADFRQPDLGVADSVFDGVDTIYHLAGATRAVSAAGFNEANVSITERILDRVARRDASPRFVYVSSQAAAGPSLPPSWNLPLSPSDPLRVNSAKGARRQHVITEDDPPAPIEAYGRSKLAAEQVVRSRATRIPVTILRPVAVYGPGDHDFLSMFRLVRRGVAIYPGIRDATVTTIFVADLVRGIIAAAHAPTAVGETYFMGHPQFATWREIYQAAAEIIGRKRLREIDIPLPLVRIGAIAGDMFGFVTRRPPLLTSGKAALAAPRFWTCSSARAARDFGFTATTSLHDGLQATYDWYRSHRWL
jgi:nucleoside-diphosphate-sugar epimerase